MLKKILAISGKPGLYRLVSHGNRSLIVETLEAKPKRMPVFSTDKVVSLPTYDRERVHISDIKKLIQWYDLLVENGVTDFSEEQPEAAEAAEPEA